MKINQYFFSSLEISSIKDNWKLGFFGNSIDDRGDFSRRFLNENCETVSSIEYDKNKFEIKIDEVSSLFEQDSFTFKDICERAIVDLTTIGFVELLYILKIAKNENIPIDLIYAEPSQYKKFNCDIPVVQKQYDLSQEVNDFTSLPGFISIEESLDSIEYAFLAGYEANRIEAAFEYKEDIMGRNSHMIFGIPPYKTGWETNALFNNINVIDNERIESVAFCGATDVISIYGKLMEMINSLPNEDSNLCILPLSNKPMSLSAALALLEKREMTSVLYDNVIPIASRSIEIGRVHYYQIKWDE